MVRNLTSKRTGRNVANQFVITLNGCSYFQSYKTLIAKVDESGKITLSSYWNYSNTTRKYLYQFLAEHGYCGMNGDKVQALINSNEIGYTSRIAM